MFYTDPFFPDDSFRSCVSFTCKHSIKEGRRSISGSSTMYYLEKYVFLKRPDSHLYNRLFLLLDSEDWTNIA